MRFEILPGFFLEGFLEIQPEYVLNSTRNSARIWPEIFSEFNQYFFQDFNRNPRNSPKVFFPNSAWSSSRISPRILQEIYPEFSQNSCRVSCSVEFLCNFPGAHPGFHPEFFQDSAWNTSSLWLQSFQYFSRNSSILLNWDSNIQYPSLNFQTHLIRCNFVRL